MQRATAPNRRSLARRLLFGACGLSLLALLGVYVVLPRFASPGAGSVGLHIDDQGTSLRARVGETNYVGVEFTTDGTGVIQLLAASLSGVPRGLQVTVAAQRPYLPLGPRYVGGDSESSMRIKFPLWHSYPVSAVRIKPGADPGWELVIVAKATQPGDFNTTGLDVTASQDGRVATVHANLTLQVQVSDPKRPMDMSKPVFLLGDCPGSEAPTPPTWDDAVARALRAGGGEALIRIVKGKSSDVWNTVDGSRPTQAMVNSGFVPAIYESDSLVIDRVIAGPLHPGPATGLSLGGDLGADAEGGCSWAVDGSQLYSGTNTYLAIYGPAPAFAHSAQQPVIELRNLALVDSGVAATPYGPVPISAN